MLGELYPQLIRLRDSSDHGVEGQFDIVYKGFHIRWVGELPETLIAKNPSNGQWENPDHHWSNDGWEHS